MVTCNTKKMCRVMYRHIKGPRKAFFEIAVALDSKGKKGQREQQMQRPQDREERRVFKDTTEGQRGWTLGVGWESGWRWGWAPAGAPHVRSLGHLRDFDLWP